MASQRQRRREGAQRSAEAQVRRTEAQRRARRRRLRTGAVVLAVIVALVVAVAVPRGPRLGESVAALASAHAPPYIYNSQPPTSGNHLGTQLPYGHRSEPLVAEAAVHNMEHGAVVIWYRQGSDDLVSEVDALVRQLGPTCLVAGPYPGVGSAVAATTWGRILELDEFDGEQLREFVDAYRGRNGPEAGVCRR